MRTQRWLQRIKTGKSFGTVLDQYEALIDELRDKIVERAKAEAVSLDVSPEQWAEYVDEETFELLLRAGLQP